MPRFLFSPFFYSHPPCDVPLCAAGVGRYNDTVLDGEVTADPVKRARLGVEVVDGDVEEALDLRGVQVHGDDVVAARRLEHVGHETCGDGGAGLVLLVLASVGEVGQHGRDATCRRRLAGVDHDQELHDSVVDVARSGGLEDEDCATASVRWLPSAGEHPSGKEEEGEEEEEEGEEYIPSSSRTDSPIEIDDSWFEY